jgi:hypothetical protein
VQERTPPRDVGGIVFFSIREVKEIDLAMLFYRYQSGFVPLCVPTVAHRNPKTDLEARILKRWPIRKQILDQPSFSH